MKKTKKRQKLGEGYIWFSSDKFQGKRWGYTDVRLTAVRDGQGGARLLKIGKLGGWQKVKLYAEWVS